MVQVGGASGGSDFAPCPEGTHKAVLVDNYWMGWIGGGQYGWQQKIRLVWMVEKTFDVEEGSNAGKKMHFTVGEMYTMTLGAKSNLRKTLKAMRGHDLTEDELSDDGDNFDIDDLHGTQCRVMVVHSADGKYANAESLMPLDEGEVAMVSTSDYVCMSKRPADKQYKPKHPTKPADPHSPKPQDLDEKYGPTPNDDDDIPF